MPTTTTTYSFNKPVVGADEDDWGGYLNGNWDSVDDLLDGTTPVTGIDINSGTLDGVTIGGTTAGAGTFTTLTANTSITGTLATAAQPNITSVGSLTSLDVGGTVTADGLTVDGGLTLNADLDVAEVKFQSTANAKVKVVSSTTGNSILMLGDTDDNDIGMIDYDNADNSMRFVTNTSEAMRIDSSGNVGIGTSSPSSFNSAANNLVVGTGASGDDTGITIYTNSNSSAHLLFADGTSGNASYAGYIRYNHPSDFMAFHNNGGNERMRIDSSGNTIIKAGKELRLNRPDDATYGAISHGASGTGIVYNDVNGDGHHWQFAGSEKMRIDSSGNLLVGTTQVRLTEFGQTDVGINLLGQSGQEGQIQAQTSGTPVALFSRRTSDGDIVQFRKDGTTVGSIGAVSGDMYLATGDVGLRFNDNVDLIHPTDGSGANRDAAIDLGGSVTRFKDLYLSGGVYLGGVGASNKLEDYEEGEFDVTATPSISGTVTLNGSVNRASYTKVGRLVHCSGFFTVSGVSSPVGTELRMTLPFAAGNGVDQALRVGMPIVYYDGSSDTVKPALVIETESFIKIIMDCSTIVFGDAFYFGFTYQSA